MILTVAAQPTKYPVDMKKEPVQQLFCIRFYRAIALCGPDPRLFRGSGLSFARRLFGERNMLGVGASLDLHRAESSMSFSVAGITNWLVWVLSKRFLVPSWHACVPPRRNSASKLVSWLRDGVSPYQRLLIRMGV